jgi:hypothetical protein
MMLVFLSQAACFNSHQAGGILPIHLFVSEFASSTIGTATVSPESIATLFLTRFTLDLNQVLLSMSESAFVAIGTMALFLESAA